MGAVTYLTHSIYGKNDKIWINPADNFTTGCSGDSVDSAPTSGCLYSYETVKGKNASTTGNIYGIYDISGGAWAYIAAYVDNGHDRLQTYGDNILKASSKYKDVYAKSSIADSDEENFKLAINKKAMQCMKLVQMVMDLIPGMVNTGICLILIILGLVEVVCLHFMKWLVLLHIVLIRAKRYHIIILYQFL